MKMSIIDDFVTIYHSNCFACKQLVISEMIFSDVSNTSTSDLEWAINLLRSAPKWKWMRTGNSKCQRLCIDCVEKKQQMTKLVLTRGYIDVAKSVEIRHRTLPSLVQTCGMRQIERI